MSDIILESLDSVFGTIKEIPAEENLKLLDAINAGEFNIMRLTTEEIGEYFGVKIKTKVFGSPESVYLAKALKKCGFFRYTTKRLGKTVKVWIKENEPRYMALKDKKFEKAEKERLKKEKKERMFNEYYASRADDPLLYKIDSITQEICKNMNTETLTKQHDFNGVMLNYLDFDLLEKIYKYRYELDRLTITEIFESFETTYSNKKSLKIVLKAIGFVEIRIRGRRLYKYVGHAVL